MLFGKKEKELKEKVANLEVAVKGLLEERDAALSANKVLSDKVEKLTAELKKVKDVKKTTTTTTTKTTGSKKTTKTASSK